MNEAVWERICTILVVQVGRDTLSERSVYFQCCWHHRAGRLAHILGTCLVCNYTEVWNIGGMPPSPSPYWNWSKKQTEMMMMSQGKHQQWHFPTSGAYRRLWRESCSRLTSVRFRPNNTLWQLLVKPKDPVYTTWATEWSCLQDSLQGLFHGIRGTVWSLPYTCGRLKEHGRAVWNGDVNSSGTQLRCSSTILIGIQGYWLGHGISTVKRTPWTENVDLFLPNTAPYWQDVKDTDDYLATPTHSSFDFMYHMHMHMVLMITLA